MFSIKPLPEFTTWLDGLTDAAVRGLVVARVKLVGGSKRTQKRDIKRAKALAALLD